MPIELNKVKKFPVKKLGRGQVLFEVDQTANTAYLVVEGVLVVGCSSPNGREVITAVYFPGEICGGLSVLMGTEYAGTARAPKKNGTVVTPLSRSQLLTLIEEEPDFHRALLLTNQDKERFKDRMLLGMVADSCRQRTAAALLWLHDREIKAVESVPNYLCRQELADLIGTTVETVIRVLSSFRKKGLIQENRGCIRLDVPRLQELLLAVA